MNKIFIVWVNLYSYLMNNGIYGFVEVDLVRRGVGRNLEVFVCFDFVLF